MTVQIETFLPSGVHSGLKVEPCPFGVNVSPGKAYVRGVFYYNDYLHRIKITPPGNGDISLRVVLRADFRNQTVRLETLTSGDGAPTLPPLVQEARVIYEIPLASFVMDSLGTIYTDTSKEKQGVTDEREFVPDSSQ